MRRADSAHPAFFLRTARAAARVAIATFWQRHRASSWPYPCGAGLPGAWLFMPLQPPLVPRPWRPCGHRRPWRPCGHRRTRHERGRSTARWTGPRLPRAAEALHDHVGSFVANTAAASSTGSPRRPAWSTPADPPPLMCRPPFFGRHTRRRAPAWAVPAAGAGSAARSKCTGGGRSSPGRSGRARSGPGGRRR